MIAKSKMNRGPGRLLSLSHVPKIDIVSLYIGAKATGEPAVHDILELPNCSSPLHPEVFQKLNLQLQNNLKELHDQYACYVKCTLESVRQSGKNFVESFNRNGKLVALPSLTTTLETDSLKLLKCLAH